MQEENRQGMSPKRDTSSKKVLGNPTLYAQFLRGNIDIPFLKNVQPQDIEDVSERYIPYLGTEFEADTVKRVWLHISEEEQEPLFLISLTEHKSRVDYNVSMQLLKYMVCIWLDYVVKDTPETILDVIVSVMESLCIKIGATEEEMQECVSKVRERRMGYLFENIEKMDIQAERRNTAEAREEAKKAHEEARAAKEETRKVKEEIRESQENTIKSVISVCQRLETSKEQAVKEVMEICNKDRETALQKVEQYWQ